MSYFFCTQWEKNNNIVNLCYLNRQMKNKNPNPQKTCWAFLGGVTKCFWCSFKVYKTPPASKGLPKGLPWSLVKLWFVSSQQGLFLWSWAFHRCQAKSNFCSVGEFPLHSAKPTNLRAATEFLGSASHWWWLIRLTWIWKTILLQRVWPHGPVSIMGFYQEKTFSCSCS